MGNYKRRRHWAFGDSSGTFVNEPLFDLWALRILALPGVLARAKHRDIFEMEDQFFKRLGIPATDNPNSNDPEAEPTQATIKRVLKAKERKLPAFPEPLATNLISLGEEIGLTELEQTLLGFYIILNSTPWLDNVADQLGSNLSNPLVCHALSAILHFPSEAISQALSCKSTLTTAGLLRFDRSACGNLRSRVDLGSGVSGALMSQKNSANELLSAFFQIAQPANLTVEDYSHVAEDIALLRPLLANTCKNQTHGVNILLYGTPGTGKTELARLLASEASVPLYEVSTVDEDGDPRPGEKRLSVFRLSQQVLKRRLPCALLFDEIEDAFPSRFSLSPFWGQAKPVGQQKAWTNQLLESNPVPAIWISNQIEQIDEAFLRRFTYILQLETPSRKARRRLIENKVQPLAVSERWIDRLADENHIKPAHIETAVRAASFMQVSPGKSAEAAIMRTLSHLSEVCGNPLPPFLASSDPITYHLEYVNPSFDLEAVLQGLRTTPSGRLCLYGPPGTGKTAFGKYLAEQLDKPLMVRRASDLLNMYVGQTEKLTAQMFREAEQDGAVLLLDEADSFLRDRSNAVRSWEVTQVNEFLTGMEHFEGIFIASTNLLRDLDQAVFRRFDFKIEFRPLTRAQRFALCNQILRDQAQTELDASNPAVRRLEALDQLTPGDFAAALRRLRLVKKLSASTFLDALAEECVHKPGGQHRPIGFIN